MPEMSFKQAGAPLNNAYAVPDKTQVSFH